ncbi:hypothetical protein [Gimesia fumaroli]|uniref:EF-hand domain-containing protein n=1 Tax=Gimesia fumaroli TaxID=2527976 RepID=A0A518IFA6_9PLAN|nr:hypothetical protein [Gimesia fumaroli]QDV51767.1 hypothetical protein Enr17x_38250 [Gimesia fumaroli]
MNAMLLPLLLFCDVGTDIPEIVFDNRPESGVPREARDQDRTGSLTREELKALYATLTAQETIDRWPIKFHNAMSTIKRVRIRYFNKETWKTEKQAREYVRGFLANKSSEVYSFQIWSQGVGIPEIDCLVDFTDEYRKELIDKRKPISTGRLLIWNGEACFRDATSRWWFVTIYNHYHRAHPKGDRTLAKPKKPK